MDKGPEFSVQKRNILIVVVIISIIINMRYLLIFLFFIVVHSFSQISFAENVDYSECSKLFQKHRGKDYSSFFPPFEIEKNGKVKALPGYRSFISGYDEGGKMNDPSSTTIRHRNSSASKKDFVTIFHRDNDGQLTSLEGTLENDGQDWLNFMFKELSGQYDEFGEIKNKDSVNHNFNKVRWVYRFEVKGGKCVPIDSVEELSGKNKKGVLESKKMTLYKMDLCKQLYDFFEKSPQTKACFDKNLNTKVESILDGHKIDTSSIPTEALSRGIGSDYYSSLEGKLYNLKMKKSRGSGHLPLGQKEFGKYGEALLTAHNILQDCHRNGLSPFLKDPKIWEKKAAVQEDQLRGGGSTDSTQ